MQHYSQLSVPHAQTTLFKLPDAAHSKEGLMPGLVQDFLVGAGAGLARG